MIRCIKITRITLTFLNNKCQTQLLSNLTSIITATHSAVVSK